MAFVINSLECVICPYFYKDEKDNPACHYPLGDDMCDLIKKKESEEK